MRRSARRMHRNVIASSVVPTASYFHVAPHFGSRYFGRADTIGDRLGASSSQQHQLPQSTRPVTSPPRAVAPGGRYRYRDLFGGASLSVSTLLSASSGAPTGQGGLVGVAFALVTTTMYQYGRLKPRVPLSPVVGSM